MVVKFDQTSWCMQVYIDILSSQSPAEASVRLFTARRLHAKVRPFDRSSSSLDISSETYREYPCQSKRHVSRERDLMQIVLQIQSQLDTLPVSDNSALVDKIVQCMASPACTPAAMAALAESLASLVVQIKDWQDPLGDLGKASHTCSQEGTFVWMLRCWCFMCAEHDSLLL